MGHEMHDESPPVPAQRNGGFVYFDMPDSCVRERPLITCSGWMIHDGEPK